MNKEIQPIITKIGNAISINPFRKRNNKKNGSTQTEHITFESPQAALIANFKILPNTIIISIININVNICFLPLKMYLNILNTLRN